MMQPKGPGNGFKGKIQALQQTIATMTAKVEQMDASYRRRIQNQVDSINRLLGDNDAGAEIARLHERIQELEDFINSSSSSVIEVRKDPDPETDPAEAGVGDTGHEPDWVPPVSLGRPQRDLPSL